MYYSTVYVGMDVLKENSPTVIQYADIANERLRRKFYKLTLKNGKKANVAKTAIARELAGFIWDMMTERYA